MPSLIPSVIVEVVAVTSGTIISVGIPLILAKLNKISKIHTTLFGLEDVENMGGLVSAVDANNTKLEKVEEKADKALGKTEQLTEKVNEIHKRVTSNGDTE